MQFYESKSVSNLTNSKLIIILSYIHINESNNNSTLIIRSNKFILKFHFFLYSYPHFGVEKSFKSSSISKSHFCSTQKFHPR